MFSWFAIPFHAVRLGFEAQNALAFRLLRLIGYLASAKTEASDIADAIPNKITTPSNIQTVSTDVAPDRGRRRGAVRKVPKKRVRANKRKHPNGRSGQARLH